MDVLLHGFVGCPLAAGDLGDEVEDEFAGVGEGGEEDMRVMAARRDTGSEATLSGLGSGSCFDSGSDSCFCSGSSTKCPDLCAECICPS